MDQIRRAMAKARAQVPPNLHPVDEGAEGPSRFAYERVPRPIDTDTTALALNPGVLQAHRIVAWQKGDPRTAPFDILRTKVLKAMKARGWTTVAVTSPTQDSGKTTVAINLAFSMAHQIPSDVVLVDFDLRRPQVSAYLGIDDAGDLSRFLEGHAPLKTHRVSAGGACLSVVANQGTRQNSTELLGKARLEQFVGGLRGESPSRIGVFDLPPLIGTDDTLAVLPRIDCALLVVAERGTRKADIAEAMNLLSGINVLGIVLNQSRAKLKSYY